MSVYTCKCESDRKCACRNFKRPHEDYLLPLGGRVRNVEPAQSLFNLIKALILRDWGSEGTRGHGGKKRRGRKVRDKGVD